MVYVKDIINLSFWRSEFVGVIKYFVFALVVDRKNN